MNPRPEVFDQWRGQSVDDVLCLCRDTVEEADFSSVQRWREAGGKVVGHFQVYFPRELAHAAGLLPVKVCGAPVEVTEADSRFGSYLCSILKTSIELALSGRVEFDMFVSHPICDAARNLAAIWSRNFDYPSQILYLPQNPNSEGSVPYLQAEYRRLLGDIMQGAIESLTKRSVQLMKRIKGKPEYTLIGGILRFSSMQRTVEDQLRAAVNVPSDADCQFACALGAGLLGHIRLAKLKTEGSNRVQPGL